MSQCGRYLAQGSSRSPCSNFSLKLPAGWRTSRQPQLPPLPRRPRYALPALVWRCRSPGAGHGGSSGARTALHRGMVFPELVAKRMAALEPDVVEIAEDCVGQALNEGPVDFMTAIGNVVPITMISHLIGFHDSDLDQLLNAAFDSTAMLGSTLSYDELVANIARTGEIEKWVSHLLSAAMSRPSHDLLGAVAEGVNKKAFSEVQAVVILHTLLSAGGESTTSLIGNAVRILTENPDLQSQLRRSPELIPMFRGGGAEAGTTLPLSHAPRAE
jgi:cytochrome P450